MNNTIFSPQPRLPIRHRILLLLLLSATLLLYACGDKAVSASSTGATTAAGPSLPRAKTDPPQHGTPARYALGNRLYCYAKSGLVLRDQPAQSGAKLASVPLFDNVEVVDENTFQTAFQVKESFGLVVDGHWVQVRHKGKVGWLFDGYLLSYPPEGNFTYEAYWDQFGKVIFKTDKPPKGSENLWVYNELKWDNGVHYTYKRGEGGGAFTTKLPKALFSFSQAYLFATQEIPESEHPERWSFAYDQSANKIRASLEEEYREIVVEQDEHGNSVIIKSYGD